MSDVLSEDRGQAEEERGKAPGCSSYLAPWKMHLPRHAARAVRHLTAAPRKLGWGDLCASTHSSSFLATLCKFQLRMF